MINRNRNYKAFMYFVLFGVIAAGAYSIRHPEKRKPEDMNVEDRYHYYQLQADTLFTKLMSIENADAPIPADLVTQYDAAYDSAYKYKLLLSQQ